MVTFKSLLRKGVLGLVTIPFTVSVGFCRYFTRSIAKGLAINIVSTGKGLGETEELGEGPVGVGPGPMLIITLSWTTKLYVAPFAALTTLAKILMMPAG